MNLNFTSLFSLLIGVLFLSPNMVSAQSQSPLDIALRHLEQNREVLELTKADIRNYSLSDQYFSRHNGLTHIYLRQEHAGIPVLGALSNINILSNGEILNMGNRFISDLQAKVNVELPAISAEEALQTALRKFQQNATTSLKLQKKVDDRHFVFDNTNIALEPISVQLYYQMMDDESARLVWQVQLYTLSAQNEWSINVDAQNASILNYRDQVIHCSFDRGGDCAAPNHNHNHAKVNRKSTAKSTNDLNLANNVYNIFPVPVESPNHGDRALITAPSEALASPFGWHDTDGVAGPEYTITRGNNVHAYQDIFALNRSLDDEPDGGDSLVFDYPLDLSTGKPYTQIAPAVVNLFYWNNIIHDVWYQYGFDEETGNFQTNNYGRGGLEEDYVRAEAMDGSGTDNANFRSGIDGERGRMQMYIWEVDSFPVRTYDSLIVTAPANLAGKYRMAQAQFGPELSTDIAIISEVVIVSDTVDVDSDACEDIINGMDLVGKTALIDRGDCDIDSKVFKAQNSGAIAVIICNDGDGAPFRAGGDLFADTITIPMVMVSREDCDTLRTGLPLSIELIGVKYIVDTPGPTGLDSDFDNGIIVHEYGHGISIRTTGGPSESSCLTNFEQAGEGWSDWFALVMQTDLSNYAEEVRGVGTYSTAQAVDSTGIRDYPYSRDMDTNPHTYSAIDSVSVPHGVGSVWAAMIWDMYWNLVDVYGFSEDLYSGTAGNNIAMQLVMDGLKLQPCNPTFLESRDAILAADMANNNGANQCLIWRTFARRGLGLVAAAGGIEDYSYPADCNTFLKVDKIAEPEIERGELINYTLNIINASAETQSNITMTDVFPAGTTLVDGSVSCTNATVDNGVLTLDIASMNVGDTIVCSYQLLSDNSPFSITVFEETADSLSLWKSSASLGITKWIISEGNGRNGGAAFFAEDIAQQSDQRLTLREPIMVNGANPALSFWHSYDTEVNGDGGVIEYRTEVGTDWLDLGRFMISNGYFSRLKASLTGPLPSRASFNGKSDGYIQTIVDLSEFVGEELEIRFRFGCDNAIDGGGWFVDDIRYYDDLYTITNEACIGSDSDEEFCSEAVTIVQGEIMDATTNPDNQLGIALFPNPTEGKVLLQMTNPSNDPAKISLHNVAGQLLYFEELEFSTGSFELDLSTFTTGIYWLQVQTDTGLAVKKIIRQ